MSKKLLERIKNATPKTIKRFFTLIIGITLLIIGIILIFTPGPAIIVIPIALIILSTEFAWARYWIRHIKSRVTKYNSSLEKYFPKDEDE